MQQGATPGAAFGRYEWIFIALGALAAFWLHWHFRMSGFGEQDAGRLASDAINWHFEGSIDMTKVDYRLHTSPLYIHGMKLANPSLSQMSRHCSSETESPNHW